MPLPSQTSNFLLAATSSTLSGTSKTAQFYATSCLGITTPFVTAGEEQPSQHAPSVAARSHPCPCRASGQARRRDPPIHSNPRNSRGPAPRRSGRSHAAPRRDRGRSPDRRGSGQSARLRRGPERRLLAGLHAAGRGGHQQLASRRHKSHTQRREERRRAAVLRLPPRARHVLCRAGRRRRPRLQGLREFGHVPGRPRDHGALKRASSCPR